MMKDEMKLEEIAENTPEYEEFVAKFNKKPEKTTDDCYTPPEIYDAVADWVANEFDLSRENFVRPFYPGGDYEAEEYKPTDVVVDNPPFSIVTPIANFYSKNGVKFFLFCPGLTFMGTAKNAADCSYLGTGVNITYANGAVVPTSFITNLYEEPVITTAPSLYKAVSEVNDRLTQKEKLPGYRFPANVIYPAELNQMSKYGVSFTVRKKYTHLISRLESQREAKKTVFGHGRLISEQARREYEQARKIPWPLSSTEEEIIKELTEKQSQDETKNRRG